MSSLVVDTHAAVWYLLKSSRLSTAAAAAIEQATETEGRIYLASISLVEVIYLAEKGRVSQEAIERLLAALSDPQTGWVLAPLDLGITEAVARISRDSIPDMPDRIITATAVHLDLPLVTRDARIRAANLKTIW